MKDQPRPLVEIYTDGACSPNPGIGGWGAILISPAHGARREISGAEADTTNNRMELLAAIKALESLNRPCQVALYTDSQYLSKAFSEGWLERWKSNGWRASKRAVQNSDLWKELDRLSKLHELAWHWIRGHSNHPENERADRLAVEAREAFRKELP